jgi:hypothetical protein
MYMAAAVCSKAGGRIHFIAPERTTWSLIAYKKAQFDAGPLRSRRCRSCLSHLHHRLERPRIRPCALRRLQAAGRFDRRIGIIAAKAIRRQSRAA